MTVVMFQRQFVPKVLDGSKSHTIRPERNRPIVVGDHLSLRMWAGKAYRSPQQVLLEATCTNVQQIRISWSGTGRPVHLDGVLLSAADAKDLAAADGFTSDVGMMSWFDATHRLPFTGVLISWERWRCKHCGCHDTAGCPGVCSWIAPNLCSVCVDKLEREARRG